MSRQVEVTTVPGISKFVNFEDDGSLTVEQAVKLSEIPLPANHTFRLNGAPTNGSAELSDGDMVEISAIVKGA